MKYVFNFSHCIKMITDHCPSNVISYKHPYGAIQSLGSWSEVAKKVLNYYYQTEGIKYTKITLTEFLMNKNNHNKFLFDLNYIFYISKSGLEINEKDFK